MNDKILILYCIVDDLLKALNHPEDPRRQMEDAEVITTGTFSNEAKLVSQQTAVELIDGATLAGLIRKHLPDVANRLALPR